MLPGKEIERIERMTPTVEMNYFMMVSFATRISDCGIWLLEEWMNAWVLELLDYWDAQSDNAECLDC